MNRLFLMILFCMNGLLAVAQQTVGGCVKDDMDLPLGRAIIKVYPANSDKMISYTLTDAEGKYQVRLGTEKGSYRLQCTFMGFRTETVSTTPSQSVYDFRMKEETVNLKEVTVKAPPIRSHNDTLVYNVFTFKTDADHSLLDVIKKLPGISVDAKGEIKYQNEPINKFYIEDLDMLGGQYNMATMNLHPDDVASISVYENHQPQKVLQDLKQSNQAALNIRLSETRRNKLLGTVKAGAGAGSHADYLAELFLMMVGRKGQQLYSAKSTNYGNTYTQEFADYAQPVASRQGATEILSTALTPNTQGPGDIPLTRYNDNLAVAASGNHLTKLGDDASFRINASFQYDKDKFLVETNRIYLGTGNIHHQEAIADRNSHYQMGLSAQYNLNAANLYLKDMLRISGDIMQNRKDVQGLSGILQKQKMKEFSLQNQMDMVSKKGKRIFELSSTTILSTLPVGGISTGSMSQDMDGFGFYNRERTILSKAINSYWVYGSALQFEVSYDRLATNLLQDVLQEKNEAKGLALILQASPYIQFKSDSWNIKLQAPVSLRNMSYTNRISDTDFKKTLLHVDPQLSVGYKMSAGSRFILSAGFQQNIGDIRTIVTNPVYVDYKTSQVWGTGLMGKIKTAYVNPAYNYRNTMKGLFLNVSAVYQHDDNNLMSASTVGQQDIEQAQIARKNSSNQWNALLSASKKWFDLNTLLRIDVNATGIKNKVMRQDAELSVSTLRQMVRLSVVNDWFHNTLHTSASGSYSHNTVSLAESDRGISNWNATFRCSLTPSSSWEFYVNGYFYWTQKNESSFKPSRYLDGGIRWNAKFAELELSVKNITNSKQYTTTTYVAGDEYHYTCHLRPMEYLLSIKFPF